MQSQCLYLCFGSKIFTGVYADLTRCFLHPETPRWPTDTGSSYNFATKMISLLSQQQRHSFRSRPIHLHWRRHRLTMENTIRHKPEVKTVSQTGSSNNLATEIDVDAISLAIPMLLGPSLSLVYQPTSPDASFTQKFKYSGWIPVTGSSYNFATETDINVISMQGRQRGSG